MLPKHPKQTLHGAAVAAGWLLPTAREVDLEGSTAAGHRFLSPSSDLTVLKCQGAGSAQVRGCSRVSAPCRAPKPGEGSDKAAFISPCRATLTHSAPALKELLSHGGEGWGDWDRGNTFGPLVLPFQKNYWCCLACQCNVTIEMSASCESAFCFPKRKQAGILISPCLFPSHALICIRVNWGIQSGTSPLPTPRLMLGRDSHTHLCPLDAPGEGFGGSRDQLWAHWSLEFQFLTHQACKAKPFPLSLL